MYELHTWEDPEDGDQIVLFTSSAERAEDIFLAIEHRFAVPEGWVCDAWDCWLMFGLVKHEYEARMKCVEGIGIYNSSSGWTILSLDYAALEIPPPATSKRRGG
ncbi:hypothetical protein [Rhizorhabdus wittichii]|uniref:hypothetical protein n=1 Tax=Rhizorhabdus wittichii TaxID=160791 RepID=UPI00037406C9|nr:hypothetical protein [Rhizorhabdus wittichii]